MGTTKAKVEFFQTAGGVVAQVSGDALYHKERYNQTTWKGNPYPTQDEAASNLVSDFNGTMERKQRALRLRDIPCDWDHTVQDMPEQGQQAAAAEAPVHVFAVS